jgi:hypothetical protein
MDGWLERFKEGWMSVDACFGHVEVKEQIDQRNRDN